MEKLSLNKAAKEAGVAKATLLDALNTGRMSASRGDKGYWQIDPSELFRVFPKAGSVDSGKPIPTPYVSRQNPGHSSALEVEVKMLREQIERMEAERNRERNQLGDQIGELRAQLERQSADHRTALAVLSDQREKKRGFWGRLIS